MGSLPPRPVLEYGADVLLAQVIILLENHPLGQILRFDVVTLGLL